MLRTQNFQMLCFRRRAKTCGKFWRLHNKESVAAPSLARRNRRQWLSNSGAKVTQTAQAGSVLRIILEVVSGTSRLFLGWLTRKNNFVTTQRQASGGNFAEFVPSCKGSVIKLKGTCTDYQSAEVILGREVVVSEFRQTAAFHDSAPRRAKLSKGPWSSV